MVDPYIDYRYQEAELVTKLAKDIQLHRELMLKHLALLDPLKEDNRKLLARVKELEQEREILIEQLREAAITIAANQ